MGPIGSARELGSVICAERKRQSILQQDLADLSGVSVRFLSDLENGKPTVEFESVMKVLRALGITLLARSRIDETGRS